MGNISWENSDVFVESATLLVALYRIDWFILGKPDRKTTDDTIIWNFPETQKKVIKIKFYFCSL